MDQHTTIPVWLSDVEGGIDNCVWWAFCLGLTVGSLVYSGLVVMSWTAFVHAGLAAWSGLSLWANLKVTKARAAR